MDVGCGLGDFVRFLDDEYGTDYSYIGVDISETLISEAKKAFLGKNREFYSADFLEMEFPDVDLVFMSGALSYRVADNIECTKSFLQRAFNSANEGVAANFLSTYVDWQEEKNFHYQPEDLFGFCKGLTNWVSLFHDYPLWEFTLQLRRCPIVAARGNDENSR
jgi:SAM-dependent methyltransferase